MTGRRALLIEVDETHAQTAARRIREAERLAELMEGV